MAGFPKLDKGQMDFSNWTDIVIGDGAASSFVLGSVANPTILTLPGSSSINVRDITAVNKITQNEVEIETDAVITGALNVAGSAILGDNAGLDTITIKGNTTWYTNDPTPIATIVIDHTGNVASPGTLNFDGVVNLASAGLATTVEGGLTVTQASTLIGNVIVAGVLDINNNATIGGTLVLDAATSTLTVGTDDANNNSATIYGDLTVGSNDFASKKVIIRGAVVIGNESPSGYDYALAMGDGSQALGNNATAMGYSAIASGSQAVALGDLVTASGINSIAMGSWVTAGTAANTIVIGRGISDESRLVNNTANSLIVGFNSTTPTLTVTQTTVTVAGIANINGAANVSDTMTLSKATGTGLSVAANATVGGNLSVTGNMSVGGTQAFTGGATFAGNLTFGDNAADTATFLATLKVSDGQPTPSDTFVVAPVTGNTAIAGTVTVTGATTLNGQVNLGAHLIPVTDSTYDIGEATRRVNNFYATTLIATDTEIGGTKSETFVIDSDNTGGNLSLIFGTTADKRLTWNASVGRFQLTDDLDVEGTLAVSSHAAITGTLALNGTTSTLTVGANDANNNSATIHGDVTVGTITNRRSLIVRGSGVIGNGSATGMYAFAAGHNLVASGYGAVALGGATISSGTYSVALGGDAVSSGASTVAIGGFANASGICTVAMGERTVASGSNSIAIGYLATGSGDSSIAIGRWVTAGTAAYNIVIGRGISNESRLINNTANSLMVGFNSTTPTLTVTQTTVTVAGIANINGTANVSDTMTLSKATGTGLSVAANATVGGTLNALGGTTLHGTVTLGNSSTDTILTYGTFKVTDGQPTPSDTFVVSPATGNVLIAGNVDIGNGLDVIGNITVTGTVDGEDIALNGSRVTNLEDGTNWMLGITATETANGIITNFHMANTIAYQANKVIMTVNGQEVWNFTEDADQMGVTFDTAPEAAADIRYKYIKATV